MKIFTKASAHRIMRTGLCSLCLLGFGLSAHAAEYYDRNAMDTENPLFFEQSYDFVSRSMMDYGADKLHLHQRFSYGLNGKLALGVDTTYQFGFGDELNGFTHTGIDMKYRMADHKMVSEFIGGVKFSGRASTPDYADTVWFVGARLGRQWSSITVAGTLQSSWIFDDVYGMAYIDFIPEVYFNLSETWILGADMLLRKATRPMYDQEWIGGKIGKRYGHTMYILDTRYEFEHSELRIGAKLNILF